MNDNRNCNCGYKHGPLYICDDYSDELKKQIQEEKIRFIEHLSNDDWCKRQVLFNNIPPYAINIYRALAGIKKPFM
jgi:hypothetical protein